MHVWAYVYFYTHIQTHIVCVCTHIPYQLQKGWIYSPNAKCSQFKIVL